jgi:hypothetical protein
VRFGIMASIVTAAIWLSPIQSRAAAGLDFAWDNCLPEGGVSSKSFACNTNSGTQAIWGSFVLAADQPNFVGIDAVVDVQTQSDSLPDWWQLYNSGTCRSTALSAAFDFTSAPDTACHDPWNGQGGGGLTAYHTYWTNPQVPSGNPNASQIKLAFALPSTSPESLKAGVEYYAFKLLLSATKSTGSGSCAGCSTPTCITFSELKVAQLDGTLEDLTVPITSNVVLWQTSTPCSTPSVPLRTTWGQIRSLLK